ncbi:hypothetical protein GCM10009827_059070 [Dactylosporangium maewongense]|uniref:Uncharacterized protein n=1 Tax=Dactylosporangium maewongense TaxID=634393 RepID=A0ABP4LWR5_9ACTN
MTPFVGPAATPPARGQTLGAVLGALPHVLLMAFLILQLIVNGDPEARSFMVLLVIPELAIVPVGVFVCGVCMTQPYARAFGRGALSSTLIGATVFVLICLVTTSV